MSRLLVVDDDAATRRLLAAIFKEDGHSVIEASDGQAGLGAAAALTPDLIVMDLQMPIMDGLTALDELRTTSADIPVVMLTAERDVKQAVRAIQLGAIDYLTKPVNPDELRIVVKRALENRALRSEVEALRAQVNDGASLAHQMGPSEKIRRVIEQVNVVATTGFSVLILGETGTGKEVVAQAIHRHSERRAQPFIALDCGAIPEPLLESELFGHEKGAFTGADRKKRGQFDLANGGTVFLDEIGNLPIALQAKLLRVLESRQVQAVGAQNKTTLDVRFLAATNDDLQARTTDGRFRGDLYFRLAQYTIKLPPLRERRDDIPHLAKRFLDEVRIELRRPVTDFAPDAMAALERYQWGGNVRELRNVIRQIVLESDGHTTVSKSLVQRFVRDAAHKQSTRVSVVPLHRSLKETAEAAAREAERALITETLRLTKGNKSQAARALETDYKTLHLKMKALGIRAQDFMP
ncbi:MAG TPA: sigma-54 dependent transcriptional regulator [Kofleriaceae bacterium]|jgi:two-component system nitrogen regulation response regulator GlnG